MVADETLTYVELAKRSTSSYSRSTFNNQVSSILTKARKVTECNSLPALVTWLILTADG